MLIGFSVADSLELVIPENCSLTLLTAASRHPATISLQLRNEERILAVVTSSATTTSLQYPLNHRDSPVVIHTDSSCHFVALTSGFKTLDSLTVVEDKKECLDSSMTEVIEEAQSEFILKSKKRPLRNDENHAEERIEAPPKIRGVKGKESSEPRDLPPVPSIVVAVPRPDTTKRKKWKVHPASEDVGILVPSPKQVIKGSGVVITDYVVGKMKVPRLGSKVRVVYQAMFPDGKVFDDHMSTKNPFVFRLGAAQVIRGLDLGMEGMRIGGAREIVIPPELG